MHHFFSNLIRWVGSHLMGAPGTVGSHSASSRVIHPFLGHPLDVIQPIGSSYLNNNVYLSGCHVLLSPDISTLENSVDPDQLASDESTVI